MHLRRVIAAAIVGGLTLFGSAITYTETAGAGGPPDIGISVKKPNGQFKESVRINLDVGQRKTIRMKLVSLTGDEEPGFIYEDLGNYPHTFKTRFFDNAGVEITEPMGLPGGYDVAVPAEGTRKFTITVRRKPASDADGCVSPRVFEENGLDPDSAWITVNQAPIPASC